MNTNPTVFLEPPSAGRNDYKTPHECKPVRKGKVLIVDDEADIVGTLQVYLSENGYKTLGCISARAAIQALRKYEFDLVLIDLAMPEMNGIELLKAALKIDPHLIGIIITGRGTIESAIEAMKGGAFDYLLKPFRFEMLAPIFARAMKVRQLMQSEDTYRSLIQELNDKVGELQKSRCKGLDGELKLLELTEEVESLKAELERYREAGNNMFYHGEEL